MIHFKELEKPAAKLLKIRKQIEGLELKKDRIIENRMAADEAGNDKKIQAAQADYKELMGEIELLTASYNKTFDEAVKIAGQELEKIQKTIPQKLKEWGQKRQEQFVEFGRLCAKAEILANSLDIGPVNVADRLFPNPYSGDVNDNSAEYKAREAIKKGLAEIDKSGIYNIRQKMNELTQLKIHGKSAFELGAIVKKHMNRQRAGLNE